MFLIFILSTIEINLYSYKDTYFLGEDIWIWWEIVNKGEGTAYYEKINLSSSFNWGHFKLWDINGRELKGGFAIKGAIATTRSKKQKVYRPQMLEIKPSDTLRFNETNLIGPFGTLRFGGGGLELNNYIRPGEYLFSLFYWSKQNNSYFKIWSDTLHFFIKEPTGRESLAWDLYKLSRFEKSFYGNKIKSVEYAFEILRNYPKSNYIGSTLNNLKSLFHPYVEIEEGERERFNAITRELLDYVEENIRNYSGRTLKSALWCITFGEFKIGNSADKVREFIEKNNIPLDDKMKEFFYVPNRTLSPKP